MLSSCNDSYRTGGVSVSVHDSVFGLISHFKRFECSSMDSLLIEIAFTGRPMYFLCIYRLHSSTISDFCNDLDNVLSGYARSNLIVLGDINLNILENSNDTDRYSCLMSGLGFNSVVNVPTRVTSVSATCIDHVFIRDYYFGTINYRVEHRGITDHAFVSLFVAPIVQGRERVESVINNTIVKIDYEKLNECLESENWNFVYNCESIEASFVLFLDKLKFI